MIKNFRRKIIHFFWMIGYIKWIKYAKKHNMWIKITKEHCDNQIKDYGSLWDMWKRY